MYCYFNDNGVNGIQVAVEGKDKCDWPVRPEKVSEDKLIHIKADIEAEISNTKNLIASNEKQIGLIMTANNSLDEKMEYVFDIQNYIHEIKEDLGDLEEALGAVNFLSNIIDEYHYGHNKDYDINDIIYAGIDCWIPDEDSEI